MYWQVEDSYFASLPLNTSLFLTFIIVSGLMIIWTYSLFSNHRGHSTQAPVTGDNASREVREELSRKVALLEHRIFELKGENHLLKSGVTKAAAPDQKLSILTQQRVFLHDLATKIQILQGATEAAMVATQGLDPKAAEMLIKRLNMIKRNLDQAAELHRVNREFIIMAA
jgi:hypothetical protein